jgi:predicted O-methyltransferase YrrM
MPSPILDRHPEVIEDLAQQLPEDAVVAEIGVYKGESTELLAKHSMVVYAVDLWEDAEDIREEFLDRAAGLNIVALREDSSKAANFFPDGLFDLVYIDADHRYEAVCADIKAWLPKVRNGGKLAGHDFFMLKPIHQAKQAILDTMGRKPDRVYPDSSWEYTINRKEV